MHRLEFRVFVLIEEVEDIDFSYLSLALGKIAAACSKLRGAHTSEGSGRGEPEGEWLLAPLLHIDN